MKTKVKQILPYITAVAIFFVISVGYFTPAIFEGKALYQTDIRKGAGMARDIGEHAKENGERSLWSSRMFSGMPTYQIAPSYGATSVLMKARNVFEGWLLPAPANYLFAYMLGFFILLLALRVNPWVAIVGAIAYGFSSYFLIIIEAGHIWKVCVLELIPPTLAGIVWAYRGKFLFGSVVTALFFSLQLVSNHIQMTYYFLMFVGVFIVCRFIYDIREHQLQKFLKASVVLIVAGLISFGVNSTNLILSAKYSEQTIRGKSELTDNVGNKTSGLDRDYVTQWSSGIGETFTLFIPNTKGGASEPIGYTMKNGQWQRDNNKNKSALNQTSSPQIREYAAQQYSYWGNQPFTSGPVYVGAFIMFLFIFGLFVVKGYMKWALFAGTIFSILLSWGHNFMWLTNLFLDYFPMYNKFRAVSSILVVAELTIPVLAILCLSKIIENQRLLSEKRRQFFISLGLTGGFALLFVLAPKIFFDFSSSSDIEALKSQNLSSAAVLSIVGEIEDVRISIFRSDAWRSIIIILIGTGLLWLYGAKKIKKSLLIVSIAGLTLFDLANVDKRYLNNGDFLPKFATKTAWEMTTADKQILEDSDPNYRVFNLAVSTFNDASASYYHKSIGGYHAAKLRRYQDLIDKYLNRVNISVLSMLNMKYIITPDRSNNNQLLVQRNPDAMGYAWAVDSVRIVENADEEIAALGEIDLKTTAVVDKRFKNQLENFVSQEDDSVTIELADYKINDIKYKVKSETEQIVVFSEIYYNDGLTFWEAFIDGQPVQHFRANYVLRALRVPAGEHIVEFVFKPKAYNKLESISLSCLWIMIAGLIACLILNIKKEIKKEEN
ncbi:MAG: YfhO family protein [Prevotellaceae bacterium]|nr:YfhO family protein [Prevotellaceae bacterium]